MSKKDDIKKQIKELEDELLALNEIPQLIDNPNIDSLIVLAQQDIESLSNGDYHDDNDNIHYIYEEVMKCLYGHDVFDWINKQTS